MVYGKIILDYPVGHCNHKDHCKREAGGSASEKKICAQKQKLERCSHEPRNVGSL